MKNGKIFLGLIVGGFIMSVLLIIFVWPVLAMKSRVGNDILQAKEISTIQEGEESIFGVVIVAGDGLDEQAQLTESTKKKIEATIEVYNQGKVGKILVSAYPRKEEAGDSGTPKEAGLMIQYAVDRVIPSRNVEYKDPTIFATCVDLAGNPEISRQIIVDTDNNLFQNVYDCKRMSHHTLGVSVGASDAPRNSVMQYFRKIKNYWVTNFYAIILLGNYGE